MPHFDVPHVTQFVTFLLHDAFPVKRNQEWESILNQPVDSLRHRQIEAWLDRGHGECWLRRNDVAEIVEQTLRAEDGISNRLRAWAIMPNHVHLVVDVWEVPLSRLLNLWKGRSAREVNRLLKRNGIFWGKGYFDTLIKGRAHLARAVRYTENNPAKARFVSDPREWPWSSSRLRDAYARLPFETSASNITGVLG